MKEYFSISKTAKIVGVTAETLRHYDRIGLIKPSKVDEWTNYRYYSAQDIVYLNTIKALQSLGLTLSKIKEIIYLEDFNKIVETLTQAEKSADNKISELKSIKSKITRAKTFYESKLNQEKGENQFIQTIPKRVILISNKLSEPSIDNLYNYHRHFYEQVGKERKNEFNFEDIAGIYETKDTKNLFAVCIKYGEDKNLKVLPEGKYLCENCTDSNREETQNKLINIAKTEYSIEPLFIVEIIVLTGILKWNYQIQIYLGK